jgi:rubrerythrin
MRDIEYDSGEETAYECFDCGRIVVDERNPNQCPDCGQSMRNRLVPFE